MTRPHLGVVIVLLSWSLQGCAPVIAGVRSNAPRHDWQNIARVVGDATVIVSTASGEVLEGRLSAATDTSLEIAEASRLRRVRRDEVVRVIAIESAHTSTSRGAIIGFVIGVGSAATLCFY